MKYRLSLFTLLLAIAIVPIARTGSAQQQPAPPLTSDILPDPQYDNTYAPAVKLVAEQMPDKAYDEYLKISKEAGAQNPAIAADGTLRAVLLGYSLLNDPQPADFNKKPLEAQEALRDKEVDIARKSHDLLKTLKDDQRLADTKQAAYVLAQNWQNLETHQPADLKTAIESQIDHRNSDKWQYQIVDALVRLTGSIPAFSYWFALVLIAVIVKAITFPLTLKTYKSQREMQRIQPLMKELQEKYKNNKAELNEKMMAFYKEHHVNPFASCVPMIIQIPFMYYVYYTIRLYEYHFSHGKFLWIGSSLSHHFPQYLATDLAKFDMPLLVIYALSNYLTMKLNPTPDPAQAQQQKTTSLMMTVMFFFIFMKYQWSAAFFFYWLVLNFVSAFQQYNYIFKPNKIKASHAAAGDGIKPPDRSTGGSLIQARPVTPVPGGTTSRPRPKARKRK